MSATPLPALGQKVRPPGRRRAMGTHPVVRVAVLVIAALWTLPTLGLLISSLRPEGDVRSTGWWTVFAHPFEAAQTTMQNYANVLSADGMGAAFVNSLIVAIPATVIPVSLAAFAAYAFAWMRFRGQTVLFAVVVGLIVLPIQLALIPLLRIYTHLDLNGTFLGVWLAHAGFGLPLAIYLLYTYMVELPEDLFDSAFVDGATHRDAFLKIALPLSVPALASFAIFQFLWVWNDLLVALVFLGTDSEVATLTARLNELVGTRGEDWHLLTAGAFISMAVPVIVFLALQRFFVRGLLAGSVKG